MTNRRPHVVVVGGGLAGWVAATAAHESGAAVTLIERARRQPGWGNAVVSGGALHAVLQDPRSDPSALIATITELTDGRCDPVVVAAWAANARPTIDWIEGHGGDLMSDPAHAHRAKVFAPVRITEPGMRYKGFGVTNFLTGLRHRFVHAGGSILQPGRATGLEPGAHGGWSLEVRVGGGLRSVEANAVILADGGFQANRRLMKRYVGTDRYRLRATGSGTGDGLQMGLANGGVAVNMDGFYGHLLAREALVGDDLWPYPILDVLAEVAIVVDRRGRRLVDESWSGVTTTNAVAWSEEPLDCWLVVDHEGWEGAGRIGVTPPNPFIAEHGGTVVTAATVEELAALAGIDGGGLRASVDAVRTRPEAAIPPRTGVVNLDRPPFVAIPLVAGVTFTLGGLGVDGQGRVLDGGADPIAGLYAAGGTMGGLHGGPRAGYAGGLLEAAVFGLLAGAHAGRAKHRAMPAGRGPGIGT